MEQKTIDKLTSKILELNTDKESVYEFTCALANAKALIKNKLSAELMKLSYEATIKSLFNKLK